ncbi:RdgB/HAM1 family non-canonical purine NTP pyrophosphatase [Wenzhouxiangella sp. XN24]|uniref:RdgB/HAM1 family non-canonical purine NTP pyrophosphatase n=1 Tax=Wenzhouxiangella sp. XN24 TaxID=2713569 RepID=UPI0013EA2F49|nr:RdgB/HAM1 family non-canonical purine NTP pyrophosphatase [Wenzhouxiangella sp. XN24]
MNGVGPRVVLATGNPGKAREIGALLAPAGLEVLSQAAFGLVSADETGATFIENALLKARHAAAGSGLPAIADDSGLVVDALGGAPGIHSARYSAEGGDAANVRKLLAELEGVSEALRGARFVCVAVLLRHPADPLPIVCEGRWEGTIAGAPRGSGGFGYDPVFIPRGEKRSAAELGPGEKNRVSHRGRAFDALLERLRYAGGSPPAGRA